MARGATANIGRHRKSSEMSVWSMRTYRTISLACDIKLKIQTSIIFIYTQIRTHKHGSTRQSSICFMFVFQSHQLHTQGVLQDGDGVNTVESIPSRAPFGRVRV